MWVRHSEKSRTDTYHKTLFPEPATVWEHTVINHRKIRKSEEYSRLSWIHRSEPVVFHSLKVSPWINHVAVPLWWDLWAILWFVDGSGGDSQRRWFSCNWSPVTVTSESTSCKGGVMGVRTTGLVYMLCRLLHNDWWPQLKMKLVQAGQLDAPNACWMPSVDALPSNRKVFITVDVDTWTGYTHLPWLPSYY